MAIFCYDDQATCVLGFHMAKKATGQRPLQIAVPERLSPVSLQGQIYAAFKDAILQGQLPAGRKLPSTRALAKDLGVSRFTTEAVYELLEAEGYVTARTGSGTYVAALPTVVGSPARAQTLDPKQSTPRVCARCGSVLVASPHDGAKHGSGEIQVARAFRPDLPDVREFPGSVWARFVGRWWKHSAVDLMGDDWPVTGMRTLRELLATHLVTTRGVRCTPEQIIVVPGSRRAIDLAARTLLFPGDEAWIENPAGIHGREALLAAGARLVPVPIDGEGIRVSTGVQRSPRARLALVTPTFQWPMGMPMTLSRRLALLIWAREVNGWIVEYDTDGWFWWSGRAVPALQSQDLWERTVYCGNFAATLFPGINLSFLVVPRRLLRPFTAQLRSDGLAAAVEQAVLADFLATGHFARHLRRMRIVYGKRRREMIEEINRLLRGTLRVQPSRGGLRIVAWLPSLVDDKAASDLCAEHGVDARPMSRYRIGATSRGALILGFAAVNEDEITAGISRMAAALARLQSKTRMARSRDL
jgi:GntR family transcriptional regulator/MocR family aminotransferase